MKGPHLTTGLIPQEVCEAFDYRVDTSRSMRSRMMSTYLHAALFAFDSWMLASLREAVADMDAMYKLTIV